MGGNLRCTRCLLDFSLVLVGVLSLIAQPLGLQVKAGLGALLRGGASSELPITAPKELESLLVVRSLRLLRLIRALRLLKQFRTAAGHRWICFIGARRGHTGPPWPPLLLLAPGLETRERSPHLCKCHGVNPGAGGADAVHRCMLRRVPKKGAPNAGGRP